MTRTASSPGLNLITSLVILTVCFGVCSIPSHVAGQPDTRQESMQLRGQYQLKIAAQQLDRGLFKEAELVLDEIRGTYLEYLTDADKQELERLTARTAAALKAREEILAELRSSDQLAADGDHAGAIAKLQAIKDSPYLRDFERQQVVTSIETLRKKAVTSEQIERRQVEILFEKSLKLFELGELDKAQVGFEEVVRHDYQPRSADGRTAADYLTTIRLALSTAAEQEPPAVADEPTVPTQPAKTATYEIPPSRPVGTFEPRPEPQPEATSEEVTPEPQPQPQSAPEPMEVGVVEVIEPVVEPVQEPEPQPAPSVESTDMTSEMPVQEPAVTETAPPADVFESAAPSGDAYINEILRKRKIQREYTKAQVNEAVRRAEELLKDSQFGDARLALGTAFRLVNSNRLLLGEDYQEHITKLNLMDQQIAKAQAAWEQKQTKDQAEAIARQTRELRDRIEAQREQAVKDYMERAIKFRKEERFEEALGQIEQLLAVDARNSNALLLKDILEDEIRWRREVALIKESNKHEMELLLQTYAQGIPYEKEMNYPADWLEIAKKRKAAVTDGRDPADIAVEKQLQEKVDLSALTEQTTLAEAIDILRNSVEPPLNMVVIWRDLNDNAFITQNSPIGLSGAGLVSVPLRTGLDRVLQAVSSGPGQPALGYVIEDGIVSIATVDSLPTRYENRVYDVAELLSPPSTGYGMGMMGGMGGGMGGMGGGMMGGMGGMGGGMMGGMGGMGGMSGGYEGFDQQRARMRSYEITYIIQETIDPDSWYDTGIGEGRINSFAGTQLIIWQTPEIHEKIRAFLDRMKALLGQQVAIEARFLVVDENFLQDVGLDVEITRLYVGDRWTFSDIDMGSFEATRPVGSDISGSLAATATSNPALGFGLSYGNPLDDLQVNFIIRATQMHANAKTLTAPKAMVMNGETTMLNVSTYSNYKSDSEYTTESITTTGVDRTFGYWEHEIDTIQEGVLMSVTPVITDDKKYVLLNISTSLNNVSFTTDTVTAVDPTVGLVSDTYDLPTMDVSSISTRVLVPDKGTVLLGGLTLTAEKEREAGVPGLSKIPLFGRLFSNRSEVKDKQILLILVKPTILLKEEVEAEAVSALRGE